MQMKKTRTSSSTTTNKNDNFDVDDGDDDEEQQALTPEQRERRRKLGEGAYHLPGNPTSSNNWYADWCQYFRNNHPLFAPCLQDRLHPITKCMRAVGLIGSLMVGLVITNVLYIWFLPNYDSTSDVAVFQLSTGGFAIRNGTSITYYDQGSNSDNNNDEGSSTVSSEVTSVLADQTTVEFSSTGLIVLWTIGSAIHALFDNTIWYATSCTCLNCLDSLCCCCSSRRSDDNDNIDSGGGPVSRWVQKHRGWCNVIVIMTVVLMTAAATLAVMIRAMDEATDGNGSQSVQDMWTSIQESSSSSSSSSTIPLPSNLQGAEPVTQKENYRFLMSYGIELIFAWFVWFPVVESILFSGVLSCGGRIPGLGGRPAEIRAEQRRELDEERARNEKAAANLQRTQKRLSSKTRSPSIESSSTTRKGRKSSTKHNMRTSTSR